MSRYEGMNQSLKEAYHLFWKRISDVWIRTTAGGVRYLPETLHLCDLDTAHEIQISSTKFSPATGLFVFVEGECYPHWPTINSIKLTPYLVSTEKSYRSLIDNPSPSPAAPLVLATAAAAAAAADDDLLALPSIIPFYNLSLQDMRCRIHCTNLENSPLPIDTTDRFGWNGTGAIRFLSSSHSPPALDSFESSYLEIPIQMKVTPTTTIQLNYLSLASSFHLMMKFSLQADSTSPPPSPLEITFSFTNNGDGDDPQQQVSCSIHGMKIILPMQRKFLGTAQRFPSYHWADDSTNSIPPCSSSSFDRFPPLSWQQISFQLLSEEVRRSFSPFDEMVMTNCQLQLAHLTEEESEFTWNIGFVLGSFDIFSAPVPAPVTSQSLDENSFPQSVLIVNPEVKDFCGCQEDDRYSESSPSHLITSPFCRFLFRVAVLFRWEAMQLQQGSHISLPVTQIYFFAIRNPEILATLLSGTQFHLPSSSSSFALTGSSFLLLAEGNHSINQRDLILCGGVTSSSSFKFNLTRDMGRELSELELSLTAPSLSSYRYYAIVIRPVSDYFPKAIPLQSCPVLLIRHPVLPAATDEVSGNRSLCGQDSLTGSASG
jgi:hypothetical protein